MQSVLQLALGRIDQNQSGNFFRVGVGKYLNDRASQRVADQNIWRRNLGRMQNGMEINCKGSHGPGMRRGIRLPESGAIVRNSAGKPRDFGLNIFPSSNRLAESGFKHNYRRS